VEVTIARLIPAGSPVAGVAGVPALLRQLYARANGAYVLDDALHVFPFEATNELTVFAWNEPARWRFEYGDLVPAEAFFFAEDVFGNQFCVLDGAIQTFDAETGATERIAADLDGWAEVILADPDGLTGSGTASEWRTRNGPIPRGRRLIPKMLFILGGDASLENLYAGDAVEAMRMRGDVARQIKDLPDGTAIELKVTE
jgi:hypothetical protein